MKSTAEILEWYSRMDWKIFPCRAKSTEWKDKTTGEIRTAAAKSPLITNWPKVATKDLAQIKQWQEQFPGCMWGCATGSASGYWALDLDKHDGTDGTLAIKLYMQEHGLSLPKTLMQRTAGGGWHLLFRMPEGVDVRNATGILTGVDVRGSGGYNIIPPSINQDTGKAYYWHDKDMPIAETPAWLLELVLSKGKQTSVLDTKTPDTGAQATYSGPNGGTAYGLGAMHKEIAKLRAAVPTTRNNTLNDCAFSLFSLVAGGELDADTVTRELEAAAVSTGLPLAEVRTTLASARRAGFSNPRKAPETGPNNYLEMTVNGKPPVELPETELIPVETDPDDCAIPDALLHPGGLLQMLMDYTDQASAVYHPIFALAGAIVTVGTLAGQKFMTETNLRSNFYCIALGHSGAGKDSPQSAIPEVLLRAGCDATKHLAGHAVTSEAAILKNLAKASCASVFYLFDELGLFYAAMKKPQSAAAEIPALFMKLFSGTARQYVRHYADDKNDILVPWHHLSFYGASTPERFWENMTRSEVTDGFLARCLIFESRHDIMRPKKQINIIVPDDLKGRVAELAALPYEMDDSRGDKVQFPMPKKIWKDQDADAYFSRWEENIFNLAKKYVHTDEGLLSLYQRAAEHAHKLALIHAVSLYGTAVRNVGLASVQWACALMDAILANTVRQITANISESDFHTMTQRCIKAVNGYVKTHRGKPGAPRWYIENCLKGVDSVMVDKVLKKLLHEGSLEEKRMRNTNGSVSTLYCRCRVKDS